MAPSNRVNRWTMAETALQDLEMARENLIADLDQRLEVARDALLRANMLEDRVRGTPVHTQVLEQISTMYDEIDTAETDAETQLARLDEEIELAEFEAQAAFAELTGADRDSLVLQQT